ncbi:MAG: MlaD family protein [Bacteriovoracaceae bacterium]|nr:MlaD family protein [Bacteroidota bacterium]
MTLTNEAKIGIAVFFAVIILVGGIIFLKGMDFRSKEYKITLFYSNVNGLAEGSPITIAGLHIGKVQDMRLAGNVIAVGIEVDNKVNISKDSKAFIKSSSIMGGKQIAIAPGVSPEILRDGDTLTGAYEADLTELTSTLSPISSNVLGILERVNTTFDDPTRRNIQTILLELNRAARDLQQVIHQQGNHLDYALGNFSTFSEDMSTFAKRLDTIAVNQKGNINEGVKSIRVTAKTMEDASDKFRDASTSIDNVFKRLERGDGTLGKLMRDDRVYNHLDSLIMNINELVKDLKANPKRYVNVSVF